MYYKGGSVSWKEHLLLTSLDNLDETIQSEHSRLRQSLIKSDYKTLISDRALEEQLGSITYKLDSINSSIESFHSDFIYSMTLLIDQVEEIRDSLNKIVVKLDQIHETLKHPLLTKAAELREIGLDRLEKGLLDKALEALLKSEEAYDTDFVVQMQIGKLYLYGIDENVDLIDVELARKYLLNAARYAKSEVMTLPDAIKKSAEANFHASIACYVLSKDKHTEISSKLLEEAFKLADMATRQWSDFSLAYYHKAKFAAILKKDEHVKDSLRSAITCDKQYALKAWVDEDFMNLRPFIEKLMINMRNKSLEKFETIREKAETKITEMKTYGCPVEEVASIKKKFEEATSLAYEADTYWDVEKALNILSKDFFNEIRFSINSKHASNLGKRANTLKTAKTILLSLLILSLVFYVFSWSTAGGLFFLSIVSVGLAVYYENVFKSDIPGYIGIVVAGLLFLSSIYYWWNY